MYVYVLYKVINKFSPERDTIEPFTSEDEEIMKSLTHAAGEILGKVRHNTTTSHNTHYGQPYNIGQVSNQDMSMSDVTANQ